MKIFNAIIAAAALALLAGPASAQKSKVGPVQMYYDDNYQWPLPFEGASVLKLEGLKTAHGAWLTFSKFTDGTTEPKPQVITLMEGAVATFAPRNSCTYELRLASNPPAITMTKATGACALHQGESAMFRVLAM